MSEQQNQIIETAVERLRTGIFLVEQGTREILIAMSKPAEPGNIRAELLISALLNLKLNDLDLTAPNNPVFEQFCKMLNLNEAAVELIRECLKDA